MVSSEHQLKIDTFPSELQKESPGKPKQIIINEIGVATKIDEIALNIEFRLFPSKTVFSKVRSTLWFDDQEVKSDLLAIPQSLGETDEFQLNYKLDMRGRQVGVVQGAWRMGLREGTWEFLQKSRKTATQPQLVTWRLTTHWPILHQ